MRYTAARDQSVSTPKDQGLHITANQTARSKAVAAAHLAAIDEAVVVREGDVHHGTDHHLACFVAPRAEEVRQGTQ